MTTAATATKDPQDGGGGGPSIEVILSRSSYRVGEPVVGTIRLLPPTAAAAGANNTAGGGVAGGPRDIFSDAYVFVAGWCRMDPRWHRASEYSKVFESPAVHHNLQDRRGTTGSVEIDEHCVCVWTTNVVNLLDLKERTIGQWEDVKPKPIRGAYTPASQQRQGDHDNSAQQHSNGVGNHETATSSKAWTPLEERQLTFSFRAELPIDIPHSVRANSCRYFYAVMVGTRVRLPSSRKQWLRHGAPIQVLSLRPDQPPLQVVLPDASTTTGILSRRSSDHPLGSCTAMAHSAGLPCHVTATDLHQPTGQILVNRRGSASLGTLVVQSSNYRRNPDAAAVAARNLQTMRITDLQGCPCCVLTIMGVSTATPGSRIVLKFDFPIPRQQQQQQTQEEKQPWTPCYHVSASLEGQEVALSVDGSKKRAQGYQFDTAHERVDPECTERVCLSLLVPLNAPTTVSTDIVELTMTCTIDIAVDSSHGAAANIYNGNQCDPNFSNLRLQLPCRIVNSISEYELVLSGEDVEEDEDDAQMKLPLDELILGSHRSGTTGCEDPDDPPLVETAALRNTADSTHPSSFVTKDIRQDLKILSLRMANECDLVDR